MTADSHDELPPPPASLPGEGITLRFDRILPGDPARGFVPAYHFRIRDEAGIDVGHINLRVGATEHVLLCAGHVGFEIAPLHRGRGGTPCEPAGPWRRLPARPPPS